MRITASKIYILLIIALFVYTGISGSIAVKYCLVANIILTSLFLGVVFKESNNLKNINAVSKEHRNYACICFVIDLFSVIYLTYVISR